MPSFVTFSVAGESLRNCGELGEDAEPTRRDCMRCWMPLIGAPAAVAAGGGGAGGETGFGPVRSGRLRRMRRRNETFMRSEMQAEARCVIALGLDVESCVAPVKQAAVPYWTAQTSEADIFFALFV